MKRQAAFAALALCGAMLSAPAHAAGTVYIYTAPASALSGKGIQKLSFSPPFAGWFVAGFAVSFKPPSKPMTKVSAQEKEGGVSATTISASKNGPDVGVSATGIVKERDPAGAKDFFLDGLPDNDAIRWQNAFQFSVYIKDINHIKHDSLTRADRVTAAERRKLLDSIGKGLR